jgi:hypothetical protein
LKKILPALAPAAPRGAAGQGKFFAFFGDTRRLRRNSVEKIFPPIYAEKHRASPKVSSCFEEALICSLTANQRRCLLSNIDNLLSIIFDNFLVEISTWQNNYSAE